MFRLVFVSESKICALVISFDIRHEVSMSYLHIFVGEMTPLPGSSYCLTGKYDRWFLFMNCSTALAPNGQSYRFYGKDKALTLASNLKERLISYIALYTWFQSVFRANTLLSGRFCQFNHLDFSAANTWRQFVHKSPSLSMTRYSFTQLSELEQCRMNKRTC